MNKKRNVAGFLAIVIMVSAIFSVLPQMASEVYAASPDIQVEQGQEFYVGDYFDDMWRGGSRITASMVKASYTSSKPSVATVDRKGYFVAKETGTTTITMKYKKKKEKMKIEVIPAGTFVKDEEAIRYEEFADKIAKKMPSSISAKNGFELQKLLNDYWKANASDSIPSVSGGFLCEKDASATLGYRCTNKLIIPKAGRIQTLDYMLMEFSDKYYPPEIKSVVSAKNNKITAKLKKKFTANHLLSRYIHASIFDSDPKGNDKLKKTSKKAYGSIEIFDLNAFKTYDYGRSYKRYYGVITYKKNSNIVTIQPYTDKSKSLMYVKKGKKTKLVKGHKYRLDDSNKGPTFTLK